MDLDSNYVVARTEITSTFVHQYYVGENTFQAGAVKDDPAIPAVNDLRWHTALGFSLFATYHLTSTDSPTKNTSPEWGDVKLARSWALTAGVISDSKATVETMKGFEVNRIVHGESFAVEFCARNGLDSTKKW